MFKPSPDPVVIPSKPAPLAGERLTIEVEGLPPDKDRNRSIRSVRHPAYSDFIRLGEEAIKQMDGRAWFDDDVWLYVDLLVPAGTLKATGRGLLDYIGGIMDTPDGSHGPSFTYLPIAMQDDRQVRLGGWTKAEAESPHYRVVISFDHELERDSARVGGNWADLTKPD